MDKKTVLKLSVVFGLIYFFSPNGMASLPGMSMNFLLKEVLKLSATQAAYFGAVTILAWALKPVWGIISDAFPIFGYRRKSYLILVTLLGAVAWGILASIGQYTTGTLLLIFTLGSAFYAFQDVITDGLMVETGKPANLTGRFQSVQWTMVYVASIITALVGGIIADQARSGAGFFTYQRIFGITAIFPIVTLLAIIFFVKEQKREDHREQLRETWKSLKEAAKHLDLWLIAFFLFFWTFSPSFGSPFFYYMVDVLKFDGKFFGIAGAVSSAAAVIGAIAYGWLSKKVRMRSLLVFLIMAGTLTTLFNLIFFHSYIVANPAMAKWVILVTNVPFSAVGAMSILAVLNVAAKACPQFAEGTVFATLTSCYNLGNIASAAVGGYLFSKIGLQPLIWVSAGFTLLAIVLVPYLSLPEELTRIEKFVKGIIGIFARPFRPSKEVPTAVP